MKKIVLPHVLRRITGEEKQKVARRMRKDARKKKAKIFGTMKRNMKKAEREIKINKYFILIFITLASELLLQLIRGQNQ
ncbi:hypothetical protein EBI_27516 [Enterocytozoon bieneusi H348]|nr:hypothetical protein EBI_27516 [Enterocytozoon bieneusi H348]|eukprot:XP_002652003.1 hypothetical protein EBI_27516 [Enterocytozoon bieneusi H348]